MFVSAVIFCSLKVLFLPTFALTNMLPLFNYGLHTNRTYAINTPKFFSAPKTSLLKLAVAKHKGAIKTPALRDKSFNWPTNPSLHTSLPRAGRKLGWWLNGNMRNLSEHLFSADQVGEEGKKYQGQNHWAVIWDSKLPLEYKNVSILPPIVPFFYAQWYCYLIKMIRWRTWLLIPDNSNINIKLLLLKYPEGTKILLH